MIASHIKEIHVKEMADAISANVDSPKNNQVANLYLKDRWLTQQPLGSFVGLECAMPWHTLSSVGRI